jgi:hypothetical protein
MPRYFFHFASKHEFVPDYDGVILGSLSAAHLHATRLVSQTLPLLGSDDPREWTIEVADERQLVVLTVLFPAKGMAARLDFSRPSALCHTNVSIGLSGDIASPITWSPGS